MITLGPYKGKGSTINFTIETSQTIYRSLTVKLINSHAFVRVFCMYIHVSSECVDRFHVKRGTSEKQKPIKPKVRNKTFKTEVSTSSLSS